MRGREQRAEARDAQGSHGAGGDALANLRLGAALQRRKDQRARERAEAGQFKQLMKSKIEG